MTHELEPVALTETERLAERRFEVGHAFETEPRYIPTTTRGHRYRNICWWYASGRNDQNGVELVDDTRFADWAAARADDYHNGVTSSLSSVRELFYEYFNRAPATRPDCGGPTDGPPCKNTEPT